MSVRKPILLVALAVAVPLTSFAVFSAPNLLAGAATPSFPVACKITADITLTPPLTATGTTTTDKSAFTSVQITDTKLSGCLSAAPAGNPTKGTVPTLTVDIPATKLGRVDGHETYATGYCPSFLEKSTLDALKGLVFDITWTNGEAGTSVFTTSQATTASNTDSEVGFNFSGKEGSGSYAEKGLDQITAFFDATDSSALSTDCSGDATVSAPTFDASNSVAIL